MKIIVQDLNSTVEFCSIIQLCVFAIWSRRKQNIHFHEFFNHHVCLSFYDSMIWFVGLIVIYLEPQHDYWIWLNHYLKFVAAYSISDMNMINPRIILFPVNWKSAMLLDYRANSRQQEIRRFTFYRTDLLFRTKNLSPSSRKTELHMTYSFLHIFCYDCP